VISYAVSLRKRELGIRIALGATGLQVSRLVLRQGLLLVAGGVLLGGVGAFWLTGFLTKLLFGVAPQDPITFLAVPTLLVGVATLACYLPARRAARVDPVLAMRE
jgi:ABC-type antimicrobial peptide transport system permease subunit